MRHLLPFLGLFMAVISHAQSYRFKIFSERNGLESRFINTIDQDDRGQLVIGTGEGLYIYDGFEFTSLHEADGLGDELIHSSCKRMNREIWLGHGNGTISIYKKGKVNALDLSTSISSKITEILEDSLGNLWVFSQVNGIVKIDNNNTLVHITKGLEDFTIHSACFDAKNNLLLGTDLGIVYCVIQNNNVICRYPENFPLSNVTDIIRFNSGFLAATEDNGIFSCEIKGNKCYATPLLVNNKEIKGYYIKSIQFHKGKLYCSTNANGVVELSDWKNGQFYASSLYNESNGYTAKNINMTFTDREGNFWVGTIGEGLHVMVQDYFADYALAEAFEGTTALTKNNGKVWTGHFGRIYISENNPGNIIDSITHRQKLPSDYITALHFDLENQLWIGTQKSGLYKWNEIAKKAEYIPLSKEFSNLGINDIEDYGGTLYVATDYGLFFVEGNSVTLHATIESGLSANSIRSLFKDRKKRIWLATTTSDIPYIEQNKIKYFPEFFDNSQVSIKAYAEDKFGNIWAATDGFGVWCVTADEPVHFSRVNGMSSDYCYSLLCDSKNQLWVGHRASISRIQLSDHHINVYQPDKDSDRTFHENAILEAFGENILFGTNTGVLRYDTNRDIRNVHEPILSIIQISISDSIYSIKDFIELDYDDYKVEFIFKGVSLMNPEGVKYQYYLEGFETEWGQPVDIPWARYNHLGPGEYVFKVKCYNSDGFGGVTIRRVRIVIRPAFWQAWWFYFMTIFAVLLIIKIIIDRRERLLVANQLKLQKALDERTKEVTQQKALLEAKNKDITDSILYAKNIQNAMLPPKGALNRHFRDAFVYYKPRDIVSGDFYIVEKFGSKIIVAVADCTGHGVPGAFMSLIGSTLIKDVARMRDVNTPLELLTVLNAELNEILNKRLDKQGIPDGMDISIIDFDINTFELRFASANRPIFLYTRDEIVEVRGDRKSIGDIIERKNSIFTMQSFQMDPGDIIYMFSDGITDQFGGEHSKKLKRAGLASHLSANAHLPLTQQRLNMKLFINQWKGKNEQLDDMLMIAFQL